MVVKSQQILLINLDLRENGNKNIEQTTKYVICLDFFMYLLTFNWPERFKNQEPMLPVVKLM